LAAGKRGHFALAEPRQPQHCEQLGDSLRDLGAAGAP
jgi:hypothetical protein